MYRYCSLSCIGKIKKIGRKIHYFTPVLKKIHRAETAWQQEVAPRSTDGLSETNGRKKANLDMK